MKDHYQRVASALPSGEPLVIVPSGDRLIRSTLQTVINPVRAKGRRGTALSADKFASYWTASLYLVSPALSIAT